MAIDTDRGHYRRVRSFDLAFALVVAVALTVLGGAGLIWARQLSRWYRGVLARAPAPLRRGSIGPTPKLIRLQASVFLLLAALVWGIVASIYWSR